MSLQGAGRSSAAAAEDDRAPVAAARSRPAVFAAGKAATPAVQEGSATSARSQCCVSAYSRISTIFPSRTVKTPMFFCW
ncbi:hypothetical protein GCM10010341_48210 [Streptomyces noursei]|nr:hypothetical protein GCM10010341_48210 [Streptomyces noursei]